MVKLFAARDIGNNLSGGTIQNKTDAGEHVSVDTIGKDTDLYKLYNTNIHEKIAMGLAGPASQTEGYKTDGEEEIANNSAAQGDSWTRLYK